MYVCQMQSTLAVNQSRTWRCTFCARYRRLYVADVTAKPQCAAHSESFIFDESSTYSNLWASILKEILISFSIVKKCAKVRIYVNFDVICSLSLPSQVPTSGQESIKV